MYWIVIAAGLGAALVSLFVTPMSIALAHKLRLLDEPGTRKVHQSATPRLGGIGIFAGALLGGIPAFLLVMDVAGEPGRHFANLHLALVLGAVFVFAVGLLDDITDVSSRFKLLSLVGASAVICGAGGGLTSLHFFQGALLVEFPWWASWILTTVWICGFAVAFNFIDGLDGLSGGLAVLACVVLAYFLLALGHLAAAVAPIALAGAILGFLHYNWNPAKTFMGDSGSMTIGFVIGAMTIMYNPQINGMRSMVMPSLAISVALVDTVLTFFRRRYQQRRSMFSAERGHIHHRLLDRGFSTKQAVKCIYAISISAVLIGAVAINFDGWATLGGLSLVAPLLLMFFHFAGSVRTGEMVSAIRRKREMDRHSRGFRKSFEALQLEFDEASNFSEWWRIVCRAAEQLDFSRVELPIETPVDKRVRTLSWANPDDRCSGEAECIDAKIPLPAPNGTKASTAASIEVPTSSSLESAGERLALFSRLMADNGQQALRRIYRRDEANEKLSHPAASGEFGSLRVAVVHDFFYTFAGAERVVEQILNVVPHCAVFGLFDFLPEDERGFLRGKQVKTSFIQKMPFARRKHRGYLPLMPLAIEQLDVSGYDVVISSSYLVAKGVITGPDQLHVCYCHSPVRYGWDLQHQYLDEAGLGFGPKGMMARSILHYLRNWDARSSLGVDRFIANSDFVARRIKKFYRRDAEVIPPPVDTESFVPDPPSTDDPAAGYYLAASRLVTYKRIDLIVEAFNRTPERRLVVIGDGPELERLQRLAEPNVELLGHQPKNVLIEKMQRAKAFVFAAEEDFGIVPVEAMACGTPVIAYRKGGVTESVKAGRSGVFFDHQTVPSLLDAVERFESAGPIDDLDRKAARERAEQFSNSHFAERLKDFLRTLVQEKWPDVPTRDTSTPATLESAEEVPSTNDLPDPNSELEPQP